VAEPSEPSEPDAGRPISFNAAMARALLAGHKTQTRRPIRPLPTGRTRRDGLDWPTGPDDAPLDCRLCRVGDRLWVREPWRMGRRGIEYEADIGPAAARQLRWRAGRFMSRDASRLDLRVQWVRPERLRDLCPDAAAAEGMPPGLFNLPDQNPDGDAALAWFARLWDSFYGRSELSWDANPWVWAIGFRVFGPRG
jgi:hypothetical protein